MSRLPRAAFAGILLAALATAPAPGADSFYLSRLEGGSRAFAQGDYERAARELRIACFGLLEEPERLAEGLVRLALAAARGDDEAGFRGAFERLLEVEERFGAYSTAPVEDAIRGAFEDEVSRRIPARELASSPTFAPLAEEREATRLAALPTKARRAELERKIAADGGDVASLLALARLEAGAGRPKSAVQRLDRLLAVAPDHTEARCLRGSQLIGGGCSRAIADLGQCPAAATDPALAAGFINCLLKTGRPAEATSFLASLSDDLLRDPRVAREAGRVARLEAREVPAASGAPVPATSSQPAPPAPEAAPTRAEAPSPTVTPGPTVAPDATDRLGELERPGDDDRQQLDRARQRLSGANRSEDVDAAFEIARGLAEELPGWAEAQLLAGELAYLTSRWATAATYFRRAGEPPADRADLLFYQAVSLFESGAPAEAAQVLERALPRLERTPFVERYIGRILG